MKNPIVPLLFIILIISGFAQPALAGHCDTSAPNLGAPSDGSTVVSLTPILSVGIQFSPTDGSCSYAHTNFIVTTDPNFQSNIVVNETIPNPNFQITSGSLLPNTTYYWQVFHGIRSSHPGQPDQIHSQNFDQIWSFTTPDEFIFVPIEPPSCNWPGIVDHTPANGETATELAPTLIIKKPFFVELPACDHDLTRWVIATNPQFQNVHSDTGFESQALTSLSLTSITDPLIPNTTYYWRVKFGSNQGTESDWSNTFSFSTPGTAEQLPPVNDDPPIDDPLPGDNIGNYDTNGNCVLDDIEFFVALDQWIAQEITNQLFFAIVDAWIGQSNVCAQERRVFQSSFNLTLTTKSLEVRATQNNQLVALQVYDSNGKRISEMRGANSRLYWNLRNSENRRVANGVYYYRVVLRNIDGDLQVSNTRKFILVR
jgi:hypothetical protein